MSPFIRSAHVTSGPAPLMAHPKPCWAGPGATTRAPSVLVSQHFRSQNPGAMNRRMDRSRGSEPGSISAPRSARALKRLIENIVAQHMEIIIIIIRPLPMVQIARLACVHKTFKLAWDALRVALPAPRILLPSAGMVGLYEPPSQAVLGAMRAAGCAFPGPVRSGECSQWWFLYVNSLLFLCWNSCQLLFSGTRPYRTWPSPPWSKPS